jgi:drug/metabolite transporter (DMT)-like permease
VAVLDIDPLFVTLARIVVAAVIGCGLLAIGRQPLPRHSDLRALATVAFGVVVGFPLLTALALRHMSASSSIVFSGLLPLSTAAFAVWRGRERPSPHF